MWRYSNPLRPQCGGGKGGFSIFKMTRSMRWVFPVCLYKDNAGIPRVPVTLSRHQILLAKIEEFGKLSFYPKGHLFRLSNSERSAGLFDCFR
jgi:hypothetical protein